MNKTNKYLLEQAIRTSNTHANRLQLAIDKIQHLLPLSSKNLENLMDQDLAYLDLFTNRLAKLQDNISNKIFILILTELAEDISNKSFIDVLNRLEKLNILPSVNWWLELRTLRNNLTHEYPENLDFMAEQLNEAITQATKLLSYWVELQKIILKN